MEFVNPEPIIPVDVVNPNPPTYFDNMKPESTMFDNTQVFWDDICKYIKEAEENINGIDLYTNNVTWNPENSDQSSTFQNQLLNEKGEFLSAYQNSNISNELSALPNINVHETINYAHHQNYTAQDSLDYMYENSYNSSTYSNLNEKTSCVFQEDLADALYALNSNKIPTNDYALDPIALVNPNEITYSNVYKETNNMFEEISILLSTQIESTLPTNDYEFDPIGLVNPNEITYSNLYEETDNMFEKMSVLLPTLIESKIPTNVYAFDPMALVNPNAITYSNSCDETDNAFEEVSVVLPTQIESKLATSNYEFDPMALVNPNEITYLNLYEKNDNMFEDMPVLSPEQIISKLSKNNFKFDPFTLVDPITLYENDKNHFNTTPDLWTLDENHEYLGLLQSSTCDVTNKAESVIISGDQNIDETRIKIDANIAASEANLIGPADYTQNETTRYIDNNVATSNSTTNMVVNRRYNTRSVTRSTSLSYQNVDKNVLTSTSNSNNPVNILCDVSSTTSNHRNSMKPDNYINNSIEKSNFIPKSSVNLSNNNNLKTLINRNLDKTTNNDENIIPCKSNTPKNPYNTRSAVLTRRNTFE